MRIVLLCMVLMSNIFGIINSVVGQAQSSPDCIKPQLVWQECDQKNTKVSLGLYSNAATFPHVLYKTCKHSLSLTDWTLHSLTVRSDCHPAFGPLKKLAIDAVPAVLALSGFFFLALSPLKAEEPNCGTLGHMDRCTAATSLKLTLLALTGLQVDAYLQLI